MKSKLDSRDRLRKSIPKINTTPTYHMIPGNLRKDVSTNRSLPQCKTLPAHFNDNVMVYCLLNVIKKQDEWRCDFRRA